MDFYQNRRREQAILVQNVTAWKLRTLGSMTKLKQKSKYNHTATQRDNTNASPSPSHASLDEMIDRRARGRLGRVLKHRYKRSKMTVTTREGNMLVVRPRSGGLQGDATMPDMFSSTYDSIFML